MSLLTTCKANLIGVNVNKELLTVAIKYVAEKRGGKMVTKVLGRNVLAGFEGGGLRYSIGVCLGGKVDFIFDSDEQTVAEKIKKEIESAYNQMALARALAEEGYQIQEVKRDESRHIVLITGTKE